MYKLILTNPKQNMRGIKLGRRRDASMAVVHAVVTSGSY